MSKRGGEEQADDRHIQTPHIICRAERLIPNSDISLLLARMGFIVSDLQNRIWICPNLLKVTSPLVLEHL
jgi:hypothetical protein